MTGKVDLTKRWWEITISTGYRPTDEQFDAFFDALAELIYSDEHSHMDAGMSAVQRDWSES